MPSELTTTSYAILGLLALRPWTTYELAQQMDRAVGLFWPRARSKLYEEPKKLVAHGLARASTETVGRRPRTLYTITSKGRRALAVWVPTEPREGPVLEFELLVHVFLAEHGSRHDLLRSLRRVAEWNRARAQLGAAICRAYLDGQGQFPERLPWNIVVGKFLDEFDATVARWAEWAIDEVESWPEDLASARPNLEVLEQMARRNEEYLRSAGEEKRHAQ